MNFTKQERELRMIICQYDDTTPEFKDTDDCFEECATGGWCRLLLKRLVDYIEKKEGKK